jgi:hypothetical protein
VRREAGVGVAQADSRLSRGSRLATGLRPHHPESSNSTNSPNGTRYPLAAYRRAGMDLFAVVDYPAVDIQLDRTWSGINRKRRTHGWTSQAAGVYPGLDRFRRWVSSSDRGPDPHRRPREQPPVEAGRAHRPALRSRAQGGVDSRLRRPQCVTATEPAGIAAG